MTHSPPRLLRFQLIFFVPVAVVVAVAGLLNLGSLQSLRQTQRAASVQQADDMYRVGVATRFNQEIASIQRRVTSTLEQAGKGRLDESDVYRVHSEVVNRLARLAEDLPVLQSAAGAGAVEGGVQADFDAYRNLIVSATDLAAIDPKGAMRQAYQAASSYVALSEHTHAIATAVSAGGENDRVSDLNCFWMADDVRSPGDLFATKRTGVFGDYDQLRCYYVGYGGNANTTSRFRRYLGERGNRPLLPEHDLAGAENLLVPNAAQRIQLVAAGSTIGFYHNGRRLFAYDDPAPYTRGWFAFRTVKSHLRIRDFHVYRLVSVVGAAQTVQP